MIKNRPYIKLKLLILLCLTLAFLSAGTILFPNGGKFSRAQGAEVVCDELKSLYRLGETFTVPSAQILYGGQSYDSTKSKVMFPSGKVSANKQMLLSEAGEYEVWFYAAAQDKTVSATAKFKVNFKAFEAIGGKGASKAVYGIYEGQSGLLVNLERGESLRFNEVIDLSQKGVSDILLSFFVLPQNIGTPDASKITFTLTDAYNLDNSVDITLKNTSNLGSWADAYTYSTVNASGQPPTGLEWREVDGIRQLILHRNDEYGQLSLFSMVGLPASEGAPGTDHYTIMFDYVNRAVYNHQGLIADLDNAEHFMSLWQGFTTGEAFLSVSASQYQASAVNMVITRVLGKQLTVTEFADQSAPEITVDFGGYEQGGLPFAVVGKPYKIFPATAADSYQPNLDVQTSVFFEYYAPTPIITEIKNGVFTPNKPGRYTIVYEAYDRFGNAAQKLVNINCQSAGELSLEIEGRGFFGEAGMPLKLYSALKISGNSGVAAVQVMAKSTRSGTVNIDADTGTFIPQYAENYTVKIAVSDYIQAREYIFTVKVDKGDSYVLDGEPLLPRYLIKGASYVLPTLTAYSYQDGYPKKTAVQIFAIEDGGAEFEITSGYTVGASLKAEIIYRASSAEKRYEISAIDVGYGSTSLNTGAFFQTLYGDVQKQVTQSELQLMATRESSVEFINKLGADSLSLTFNVDGAKSNFGQLNFWITDALDSSKKVKVSYKKNGDTSLFSINDGTEYTLEAGFTGKSLYNFLLNYSSETMSISPSSSQDIRIWTYADGRTFTGFSREVYLSIEFLEVSGDSALKIFNINKNNMTVTQDKTGPVLSITVIRGDKPHGETVVIPAAFASDVLSPTVIFTMTVVDANGDYVKSVDGILLDGTNSPARDYEILLKEYGDYLVSYIAFDGLRNKTEYSYGINIVDATPPIITLSGIKDTARAGKTVALAKASVTDNVSVNLTASVYIESPNGIIISVTEPAFVPYAVGVYRIFYIAYDENGNMGMAGYTLTVS